MHCHYCEKTIDLEGGIRLGESDLFFCHSCYQTYQQKESKIWNKALHNFLDNI